MFRNPLQNNDGIGLIAALFIIVMIGMFGVLLARYTSISSQASADDYLWSQALYAAESGARRAILADDQGGGGGPLPTPQVAGFTLSVTGPTTLTPSTICQINVRATKATVSREIEIRYKL